MAQRGGAAHHEDARTQTVAVAGASFVYRQLGPRSGVPLVVLQHLGANLDNGDPRILDGLARDRGVISLGYRGVGGSTGRVSASIEEMAADAVAVIRALGHHRVDLLGQSMGGMVAQAVAAEAPELIDRLILSSAGPAGGPGLGKMTGVTIATTLRAVATFTDPKTLLFFNRTPAGKSAAREYLKRLKERTIGRDRPVTPGIVRAQLAAVHRWALRTPLDVSGFTRTRAHHPRRRGPPGPGRERHRPRPPPASRDRDGVPNRRSRCGLPAPCRVRRGRTGLPAPLTAIHFNHHSSPRKRNTP